MRKTTLLKKTIFLLFVFTSALSFSKSMLNNPTISTKSSTSQSSITVQANDTLNSNLVYKNLNNSNKESTVISNKLWFNLTSNSGIFNQILIGYVEGATDGLDGPTYDAPKNIGSNYTASLYSCIPNSTKKFIIQGKSPNSIHKGEVIKLGFGKKTDPASLYKLSISKLQGDFLSSSPIYIKDNLLNTWHDLTIGDYTFTSVVGEFNDRFEIRFEAPLLATKNETLQPKSLKIVELTNDNVQFITSNHLSIKSVQIFDVLGKQVYNFKGKTNSETYHLSNLKHSIFIAKVELSNGTVITKKAFKK
ncbi:putative secreted protein (Por secretion system target) [Mariniflexile fucanivorans]|uniref:Putative secreted protein (Por secretion system target) n=1 Tax=Mariniflexile fucanivorans TaxID=264023 RepID=A0A4R1RRP7_9FLAO|nr:T9SS type A sorting domain-containing protein [Mariniflexile fucanivorans]TCL69118.1 putative secreted protein (Por secretion system target) [Mariniflexile fucanivorans]